MHVGVERAGDPSGGKRRKGRKGDGSSLDWRQRGRQMQSMLGRGLALWRSLEELRDAAVPQKKGNGKLSWRNQGAGWSIGEAGYFRAQPNRAFIHGFVI